MDRRHRETDRQTDRATHRNTLHPHRKTKQLNTPISSTVDSIDLGYKQYHIKLQLLSNFDSTVVFAGFCGP